MDKQKITILYLRLSKEDLSADGESNSIVNQRKLLTEYAERNGFTPYETVVDDGQTGVCFDRPGWQELMEKVEAKEVSTIILKSLDRMGRNYLQMGMYREKFKEQGVRLIAVNDGIDTFENDDDFTPFREILAEFYARDTSRKIRSSFRTKGKEGKPLTVNPPYGYVKDPKDKNVWIPEEPAASVVRRIFAMTIDGIGPRKIARILHDEGIEKPAYYSAQRKRGNHQNRCDKENPCAWKTTTVSDIIMRPEYAGHVVNFRTSRQSYKSKKIIENDSANWSVFENRHEAIVPQETWDLAQKLRKTKRRTDTLGEANPLTGLVYCFDCKGKMYNARSDPKGRTYKATNGKTYVRKQYDQYLCSKYQRDKTKFRESSCASHHITTRAIHAIILKVLRCTNSYVHEHEAEFIEKIRESSAIKNSETVKSCKKQIAKNGYRIAELDRLITGLYESMIKGLLNEERFKQMSDDYEREQKELKDNTAVLQTELDAFASDSEKAEKYIELARKHANIEELTPAIINTFIERIEVHSIVWSGGIKENGRPCGTRTQDVDVYLRYIGKFEIPNTVPVEKTQ